MNATLDAHRIAKSSLVADHGSHIEARQFSSKLADADLPTVGNDAAALMPLPSFSTLIAASTLWCCASE